MNTLEINYLKDIRQDTINLIHKINKARTVKEDADLDFSSYEKTYIDEMHENLEEVLTSLTTLMAITNTRQAKQEAGLEGPTEKAPYVPIEQGFAFRVREKINNVMDFIEMNDIPFYDESDGLLDDIYGYLNEAFSSSCKFLRVVSSQLKDKEGE